MTEPKRKRGRPPGPPKPPKEPKKIGRPTLWPEKTVKIGIRAPELFFECFKDDEFKKEIWKLTLDFAARK